MRLAWLVVFLAGCATESGARARWQHASTDCATPPATTATGFRHRIDRVAARVGEPRHRGSDLVVAEGTSTQVIEGELSYTAFDKAAEDEEVAVSTCTEGRWVEVGRARTDDEGRFAVTLSGEARLTVGYHELYAQALADGSGVGFAAYVVPTTLPVVVIDVDGTLTSSENGVVREATLGTSLDAQPDAAFALQQLAQVGYQPVYVTARPRALTELTRTWLAGHGFPRGAIVMAPGLTLPGNAALDHKTRALASLRDHGVDVVAGIGNRATDVLAYTRAGIAPACLLVSSTAYAAELRAPIAAGQAVGFSRYAELPMLMARCNAK